ncbi:universal stress protein [Corallococcus sicarius]|uniref:Universal stress protein n=1 Tax=Corallococcus sicarius TaxID=2316726 RepID=A0A3A8N2I1_9BACT|nr:universal stress protein [Corallococcus sicarius]RKH37739.1 universal stress protein [Corallococcus sicarius]
MAIICATNLSADAAHAATVAATLACRLGEPLVLLGVADEAPDAEAPDALAVAEAGLAAECARLRPLVGTVQARMHRRGGSVDTLLGEEDCRSARLVVVAAQGWRTSTWKKTSLAERLARHGCAPVLVVRRDTALLDWARGRRRLLVMVGVDPRSSTSSAALGFLRELRRVGGCDVLATFVCSPAEERERLGIHSPVHVELLAPQVRDIEALDPVVERVLHREVRECVGDLEGEGRVEVVLEPGYGRPADHLLHVAHAHAVDLTVVGMHLRGGVQRLWHGSVSEGVLRHAERSVACIPPGPREPRRIPPPRSVLVPVDFTPASGQAIAQACTLVGPGGRVHLLHVHQLRGRERGPRDIHGVLPEPAGERDAVLKRLWDWVPRDAVALAVHWSVEGVSGNDVALAICQATEREGVDLVCVGTSERHEPVPDVLEGAVARELVARCRRPVMVVPTA